MIKRILNFLTAGFPSRQDHTQGWRSNIRYLRTIITDMPIGLRRVMRLQPLFTLATSIVCLALFRRGFEYIPIVIASLLFALFTIMSRIYVVRGRRGVITTIWDTALVFTLSNLLLFALPFYMESTTVPSRNMAFAPILIALTVLAGWFELYQRLIARHPLRSSLFYALTFFSVINIVLPVLFGIRNIWSLLLSMSIAAMVVALFVYPHTALLKDRKNTILFITGTVLSLSLVWIGRSMVPPAPLKMKRATACREIEHFRPKGAFRTAPAGPDTEICFYSSIFAPRGLSERIDHVWYHNGRRLFTVSLKEIHGGRDEGFGTWSRHKILEGPGRYTVEVWTAGGQLLGAETFTLN